MSMRGLKVSMSTKSLTKSTPRDNSLFPLCPHYRSSPDLSSHRVPPTSFLTTHRLQNFITDLRNAPNKEIERARVDKELANIRMKFKSDKPLASYDKQKYVWKLLYIYMLGYEIEFGHIQVKTRKRRSQKFPFVKSWENPSAKFHSSPRRHFTPPLASRFWTWSAPRSTARSKSGTSPRRSSSARPRSSAVSSSIRSSKTSSRATRASNASPSRPRPTSAAESSPRT